MLVPLGYEHELRLALVDGSTYWGALALLRGPESPDFSPADVRVAASLCSALTEGLRIGLVLGAVSVDTAPDGPGLMILDDELEILTMTPNAERWLEELHDESPGVPDAIRSVVACVRQVENADGAEEQTPRARVRGRSGRWLVIHGSRTRERDGRAAGTAIIIEEAKPSEIAPIIVRAYGLSERETNNHAPGPPRSVHQGDRCRGLRLPIHHPGPAQIDLRQGRRALPPRAGRTHPRPVLPAALRRWRQSARA